MLPSCRWPFESIFRASSSLLCIFNFIYAFSTAFIWKIRTSSSHLFRSPAQQLLSTNLPTISIFFLGKRKNKFFFCHCHECGNFTHIWNMSQIIAPIMGLHRVEKGTLYSLLLAYWLRHCILCLWLALCVRVCKYNDVQSSRLRMSSS